MTANRAEQKGGGSMSGDGTAVPEVAVAKAMMLLHGFRQFGPNAWELVDPTGDFLVAQVDTTECTCTVRVTHEFMGCLAAALAAALRR